MTQGELAKSLDKYLRTDTFPMGVKSFAGEGDLPAKAKRPKRDMGMRLSICQAISVARKYGWTMVLGREDTSCPIAKAVFGFEPEEEFYNAGNLAAGMYAADLCGGKAMEDSLARYEVDEYPFLAVGPLDRIDFEPDSVLVYGNSAQVLRLVNATLFEKGGALASEFSGRADCSDIVIKTHKTGEPQVILPCYGDRVFGMTADYEMAFTFPYAMAEQIAEGFASTHKAGVRYPVPQFLRFEADYPPKYKELEKIWTEKKG